MGGVRLAVVGAFAGWFLALSGCEAAGAAPAEGVEPGDCSDGADNDGDGHVDCRDRGCWRTAVCRARAFPDAGMPMAPSAPVVADGEPGDAGAGAAVGPVDGGDVGGTELDAGVPVVPTPLPAPDAGAGPVPGRTTGRCDRESVLRRGTPWCEDALRVSREYGCVEVVHGLGAYDKTWVGTTASLDRLNFVVELWDRVTGVRSTWACEGDPPEGWYDQTCETPFARDCKLAVDFPDRFARGADYRPICAAAARMRLTRRIMLNDRRIACARERPAF